jgi:nucleotide-binding universal stress UspA family protein
MVEPANRHIVSVKQILIPIDRSEYNNKIIEYAISLSKAWNAKITAIHVIDTGRGIGDGKDKEIKPEMIQEEKICAEDLLNEIDLTAKKEGINIEKEILEKNDKVGKTIIEYAKKNEMDVIVIGTKGMTAVEEYFFGSVVKDVFQYAHCPVFAIR